jgi:hypothetical protein
MEILIILFKSGLPREEIMKIVESREHRYREVKGLVQKHYVEDIKTGKLGGVFIFDSKESLNRFKESDLSKSTAEAYKFTEPAEIKVLEVIKNLREEEIVAAVE